MTMPCALCRDALLAGPGMSAQTSGTGALSEVDLAPAAQRVSLKAAKSVTEMQALLERTLTQLRSTGNAAASRRDTLERIQSIVRVCLFLDSLPSHVSASALQRVM